jgi:hypothetical protein
LDEERFVNTPIAIAGYQFQQLLEESSTATVWKAYQESLARNVTIKMLKPELVDNEDEVLAFLREARAVAKLKSPRIIQVYDVGERDGIPYMVMESVDGHPLSTLLDLGEPIGQKRALSIALSVAEGLSDAWDAEKLIHRNIKPSNILIEKGGDIKVANIGMSGQADENPGYIVGTPSYISPEAAQASDAVTFTTDMYSLGAVLYHMITGRIPFADLDEEETLQAQINGKLPNPQDIRPSITPPCAQLIARLMMKKPDDRYSNWQSAINDIAKLAAGKMIVAKPAAGVGSTIAAKGASKLKGLNKKPSTKKVFTKARVTKQVEVPAGKQSIAAAASVAPATPSTSVSKEQAVADAARADALKKKYSKPRTPLWIKLPLSASLMALFGWLCVALLWQPYREAYPRVRVSETVVPQPQPEPLPLPVEEDSTPTVTESTPDTDTEEYVAQSYPDPQPEPTQPLYHETTPEPEPAQPQMDMIMRNLVDTALSSGPDAAAAALRQQQGNAELRELSGFFAHENQPEQIIANNFKKLIGQETYVNMGGRQIAFRVEAVNGTTISTKVKSSTGGTAVYRPAELPISKLPVDEQRRLLGELDTPEKAFAAAQLELSTGDYAGMINSANACGPLADATRAFAQRRIDMLLE